jgi:hypothetical protein
MRVGKTKVTRIIREVIGKYAADDQIEFLRNNKFSLLIDESTDVGTKKNLVLISRRLQEDAIVDEFLAVLEVPIKIYITSFENSFIIKNSVFYF